jgi:putative acetyltransferase
VRLKVESGNEFPIDTMQNREPVHLVLAVSPETPAESFPSILHDPTVPPPAKHTSVKTDRTARTTIAAVSPASEEAQQLIRELDTEIAALYPGTPIDGIDVTEFETSGGYFVVARQADQALGCGGFRPVDERCVEIKRMFVRASARRLGIARQILRHLEAEIHRRGFRTMVLETGCNNAEAIALYEAEGYFPIPAFLGYVGIPISRCYAKWA